MSITTELTLYTTEARFGMREGAHRLLEVFGNPHKCELMWFDREERGWNEFLAEQQDYQLIRTIEKDWESIPEAIPAHEVIRRFPAAEWVNVTLRDAAIGDEMFDAISASIPESLRNNCVPCLPSVQVGWHDIWECAINSDGQYIARAFLSIRFFTYDTPSEPDQFMQAICALPVFTKFKQDLEQVTGPLSPCLIMSV